MTGLCALFSWAGGAGPHRGWGGGEVGTASLGVGTSRLHPHVDITAIERDGALSLPLLSAVISSGFSLLWLPPGQTWGPAATTQVPDCTTDQPSQLPPQKRECPGHFPPCNHCERQCLPRAPFTAECPLLSPSYLSLPPNRRHPQRNQNPRHLTPKGSGASFCSVSLSLSLPLPLSPVFFFVFFCSLLGLFHLSQVNPQNS